MTIPSLDVISVYDSFLMSINRNNWVKNAMSDFNVTTKHSRISQHCFLSFAS